MHSELKERISVVVLHTGNMLCVFLLRYVKRYVKIFLVHIKINRSLGTAGDMCVDTCASELTDLMLQQIFLEHYHALLYVLVGTLYKGDKQE